MFKKMITMLFVYIVLAMLVLPALITYCSRHSENSLPVTPSTTEEVELAFPEIIRQNDEEFENYIKGVVAAEMPALFEKEALKAQAVSARTYAVRKMQENKSEDVPYDIGQAYLSLEQMQQKWGENFQTYYNKISEAVDETRGQIMVYNNEPILAVFHAESAGKTESAENVWQQPIPYLKSVDSSLDQNAPDFEKSISLTNDEIVKRFCSKYRDIVLDSKTLAQQIKIVSHTPAGYVQQVQVGNQVLSGREVRETLGLRSSNFTIQPQNDTMLFTTKGYGHGAGMSQYGAQFMAKEGKNYKQILQHYYTGISFENYK